MKKLISLPLVTALCLSAVSQQFSMVEINPLQGSEEFIWSDSSKHIYGGGEFQSMLELDGKLYFTAQDGDYNYELWVTDGSQQGTHVVKELNLTTGSNIGTLHKLGNRLIFTATEDSVSALNQQTYDLFVSDGTAQGTLKLADLNETSPDFLNSERVAVSNNKFVFCTSDSVIATDGTASGTQALAAIAQYAQGFGYCELNGYVYFILSQNGATEIWKTNGTPGGTMAVKNLTTANIPVQYASHMKSFNGKLYIIGAVSGQGYDLFSFDGTENGTVNKVDLMQGQGSGNSYPTKLTVYNDRLWFIASNNTHTNLYSMGLTDISPTPVPSVANLDIAGDLAFANDVVYFSEPGTASIHSINAANLGHTEIQLGDKRLPYFWQTEASFLVGLGGKIFFIAYDSLMQQQYFMVSDGTTSGTYSFMPAGANTAHPFNALIGCGMADVFDFRTFGNKIVVPANFNNAGREIWFYEEPGLTNNLVEQEPILFTLFPNPTTGVVTISCNSDLGYCDGRLSITDLTGKIVMEAPFNRQITTIDVQNLAAGQYALMVNATGKLAGSKRFIVTKQGSNNHE